MNYAEVYYGLLLDLTKNKNEKYYELQYSIMCNKLINLKNKTRTSKFVNNKLNNRDKIFEFGKLQTLSFLCPFAYGTTTIIKKETNTVCKVC